MLVYSILSDISERDNMIMMVKSFTTHHPSTPITIYTDFNFPFLPGVIIKSEDELQESETHDRVFCSPYLFFVAPADRFFEVAVGSVQKTYAFRDTPNREDFYTLPKFISDVGNVSDTAGFEAYNMNVSDLYDGGYMTMMYGRLKESVVLNTREFKPWEPQRDNHKIELFPFGPYGDCMVDVEDHISQEFVSTFIENSMKYSFFGMYQVVNSDIDTVLQSIRG